MMLVKLEAEYGKTNRARNSPQMRNGYSSHQFVFGENPNLPNIMNDNLQALDGTNSSEIFAKHLNAVHAARKILTRNKV